MLLHNIILLEFTPRKISRIALAICFLVLTASCNSVETRYGFATRDDTVKAYDSFLKKFPDSEFAEDAKKRRQQVKLRNEQRRAKWKEESKKRKLRREKRRKQINKWKIKLSGLAKKRIDSGESIPEKPNDPGFPIVFCEIPNVSYKVLDKVLSVRVPYTIGSGFSFNIGFRSYICGNTGSGMKVMRWRQWYCNDVTNVYDCVAGRWENDEPTFSGVAAEQKEIIKLRRGEPDVRYRRIQLY